MSRSLGLGAEAEPGLHRVEVEVERSPGAEPEVGGDPVAVVLLEVGVDVRDLAEDVEVGRERRGRAVEEHHVLHEEHELLRRAGAVPEELLREVAQLADQLVGRHRGRVLDRLVEPEVGDDRVEVGVGRERAEVAQRRELAAHVAGAPEHEQAQEREPLALVEPAGDAEVEQRGATVGQHEQVAAVQVAVEHAVQQRALEERDQARRAAARSVSMPAALHPVRVVERRSPESRSITSTRRVTRRRVRPRDHRVRTPVLREHARDVEHVLGLEPEVELLDDRLREQLDERGRVRERGDRDAADHARAEPRQRRGGRRARGARLRGRCTLTTTSSPVRSVAACTCAIDAAASGSSSNAANTRRAGGRGPPRRPRAPRRTARPAPGRAGSLNSATSSSGKSPSPPETIWPSLM